MLCPDVERLVGKGGRPDKVVQSIHGQNGQEGATTLSHPARRTPDLPYQVGGQKEKK